MDFIIEHWAVIAGAVAFILGIPVSVIVIRYKAKAGIHEANKENIHSLRELVKTRDDEIQEGNETIAELQSTLSEKEKALDALRSEYTVIAQIKLTELIDFWGRRDIHLAEMEELKGEIRVLKIRIGRLENDAAGIVA
jgi:chromosome segregation ATPase